MEIRKLNALRGIAALIVVISHYSNASGLWNKILGDGAGQFGVMLFFLLSGFLMSYLYFDQVSDARNLKRFFQARVARVVPLYLLVVLTSYLLSQLAREPLSHALYPINDWRRLVAHLLLLHGTDVLWTIPPEMQFYALFGLAWVLRARIGSGLYVIVALLMVADYFWGFRVEEINVYGLIFLPYIIKALPYFVCGAVMGQMYRHNKIPASMLSNYYLLALAIIPLLYPDIFHLITGRESGLWTDTGLLFLLSGIFFAIVFMVPDENVVLANPASDFYGRISYSLYLLHFPILKFFKYFGLIGGVAMLMVFIGVCSLVAWLSFVTFESPSRKFVRNIMASH